MKSINPRTRALSALALALLAGAFLAGCSGDDGKDGDTGPAGTAGTAGTPGINCWDLNQNGVADLATEDMNKDGKVDTNDCRTPSGAYDAVSLHKGYFTENAYTGTTQCLNCHGKIGDDVMTTAHWKWEGTVSGIKGFEGTIHGKKDLINNFCQAVPSNEGRCSQCHIGIGWNDKTFNFGNPKNIDCLACHDQTGTYKKVATPTATIPAGGPDPSVDAEQGRAERRPQQGRAAALDLRVLPQPRRRRRQRQARRHLDAHGLRGDRESGCGRENVPAPQRRRAHGRGSQGDRHAEEGRRHDLRGLPPGEEGHRRQHAVARHRRLHVPLGGRGRDEGLHGLPRRGDEHPRGQVGREHRAGRTPGWPARHATFRRSPAKSPPTRTGGGRRRVSMRDRPNARHRPPASPQTARPSARPTASRRAASRGARMSVRRCAITTASGTA